MSERSTTPEDIAGSAGALLMRLGLAVLMIALPVAAIYSRRLVFTLMPIGAGLMFMGAALTPGNTVLADLRRMLATPAAFAAIALAVWIAASIVWTPFKRDAAEQFAKSIGTIGLAALVVASLPSRSRTSDINLLPIGSGFAAVLAALLVVAWPAAMPSAPSFETSNLERAAAGLVLLVWPALAALGIRERWASAGALAVAVTAAAVAVWTPAALAGMAAGALVFSISTARPRRIAGLLAGLFAAVILLAPLIPLILEPVARSIPAPEGFAEAISAWADTVRTIPLRLLTGIGFTTMPAALVGGYLSGTPSSILFEIWFELGVMGALALAGAVATALRAAGRIEPHAAPFLLGGITCALVISIWGLATLHLWWINLLGAMAISFACALKGQGREERPSVERVRIGPPPA